MPAFTARICGQGGTRLTTHHVSAHGQQPSDDGVREPSGKIGEAPNYRMGSERVSAGGRPLAIAWCDFQPRTVALAASLGGEACFIGSAGRWRHPALLPIRYLRSMARAWREMTTRKPSLVLAVTSPVFAPLTAWFWCWVHNRPLVIDCHTDAFHARRWRWARWIHGWLARRARAVLVHTHDDETLVRSWGGPALMLPDDMPDPKLAASLQAGIRPCVLVAGSLDPQEPVEIVIEAARLVPQIHFRFTGNPEAVSEEVRRRAPGNVVFTGWLEYPLFLGELLAADLVAAFSIDIHIMNRAAFEAIGLGCPLILSDLPQLRRRFGDAAAYCANEPGVMAQTIQSALERRSEFAQRSVDAQARLREERESALARLADLLGTPATGQPPARVLLVTQNHYPNHPVVARNVSHLVSHGIEVDLVHRTENRRGVPPPEDHPLLHRHAIRLGHRRSPAIRYALEYMAFFARAAFVVSVLGLRRRYDAVQVDNVPDLLVFSAVVPRLRGVPVILNMFELMPEMTQARLRVPATNHLVRMVTWLERRATAWADRVVTVSDPCRRILEGRGVAPEKITVLPNTQPRSQTVRRLPGTKPILITHTTIIERYGVQVAIRALHRLAATWPDLTYDVFGDGEYLPVLRDLVGKLDVGGHVNFYGFLPGREITEHIARATLGIVPILDDIYGRLLLPTKLVAYVAMELPVVCARTPTIEEYFPEHCFSYFTPGDAADLAGQIERLLQDPERARKQAKLALETMQKTLSWEAVSDRYLETLSIASSAKVLPAKPVIQDQ